MLAKIWTGPPLLTHNAMPKHPKHQVCPMGGLAGTLSLLCCLKQSIMIRRGQNCGPRNTEGIPNLSAPQRCNAERSDAQRKCFTSQFIPPFLQRHRCDALPCLSASPVIIVYIAHIAFPPLLPFVLSPKWFTVQNNKKFTKSHNAAMSPLATRDGHRKRKRKRSDAVH